MFEKNNIEDSRLILSNRKTRLFQLILVSFMAQMLFQGVSLAKSHRQKIAEELAQKIEEPFIQTPVSEEVCFSPEGNCDIKLIRLIQSAHQAIDVAIFDINLEQVVHELLKKSSEIKVRYLVDKKQSKARHSLVQTILKAGGDLRFGRQKGIMHHKFIVVDSKVLMVGSFNFTNGAAKKNQENQVYLTNGSVLKKYQDHFEQMWDDALKK